MGSDLTIDIWAERPLYTELKEGDCPNQRHEPSGEIPRRLSRAL